MISRLLWNPEFSLQPQLSCLVEVPHKSCGASFLSLAPRLCIASLASDSGLLLLDSPSDCHLPASKTDMLPCTSSAQRDILSDLE